MKITLTDRGRRKADEEIAEDTTMLDPSEGAIIATGCWSFANDLLQFLTWWEAPTRPQSLEHLVGMIVDALKCASIEASEDLVRAALSVLIKEGLIALSGEILRVGFDGLVAAYKLIGSSFRLMLLKRLTTPASGSQLAEELGHGQGKVANNLRMLESENLLVRTKVGREVHYQTDLEFIARLNESLINYLKEY